MTLKQLIKLEDKAKVVWVISPTLHYDVENKEFNELVSVNRGEKTKYRYLVPASKTVVKNMSMYKKMYNLSDEEMASNFLLLPESEFNPFIQEVAIYDPELKTKCVACSAPATEDSNDVIKFNKQTSAAMSKSFKALWKKYKRTNP